MPFPILKLLANIFKSKIYFLDLWNRNVFFYPSTQTRNEKDYLVLPSQKYTGNNFTTQIGDIATRVFGKFKFIIVDRDLMTFFIDILCFQFRVNKTIRIFQVQITRKSFNTLSIMRSNYILIFFYLILNGLKNVPWYTLMYLVFLM